MSGQALGSARSSGWERKQQLEGFDRAVMCPCSLQPEQGPGPSRSPGISGCGLSGRHRLEKKDRGNDVLQL